MTRLAVCAVCLLLALMSDGNSAVAQTGNANATSMEKNDNGTVSGVCPVPETGGCAKFPLSPDGIVRLSVVEVYPEYVGEYVRYAVEVGEISLRTEPGVITMYAMAGKENPCRITILETYSSREAYEKHIASEHFRRYKTGTLHMVKSLLLSDQTPLNPASRICNFIYK